MRHIQQNVGHGSRVVKGKHCWRRKSHHSFGTARFGYIVNPGLKRSVVRQHQVGERACLVEEAAETHHVGSFLDSLARMQAGGEGKDGIRLVEHQDFWTMRPIEQDLFKQFLHSWQSARGAGPSLRWAKSGLRREQESPRPSDAT